MTTINLHKLGKEISQWAHRNFDIVLPHLGVGEEVGEMIHAVLKREQKIRNMGTPEKFSEAIIDALADATVYLLNYCGTHDVAINEHKVYKIRHLEQTFAMEQSILSSLLQQSSVLIDDCLCEFHNNETVTVIFLKLQEFAMLQGLDLIDDCLLPTWEKVKQRDWRTFPKNGVSE